ncbi:MAG: hypothetical protein QNJ37_03750 [Crocosphaera sp.]|nr:hypothetical protein [Crocosphaera sp.]
MAEPYLLEAKVIPGTRYSQNGVVIDAGLSWLSINRQPYDITPSTVAYFKYAVLKAGSNYETRFKEVKIHDITLGTDYDYIMVNFEHVGYGGEIHFGLCFYEA